MKIEPFFSGKLNIHTKQSKKASVEKPRSDMHQGKDFETYFKTYAFNPTEEAGSAHTESDTPHTFFPRTFLMLSHCTT